MTRLECEKKLMDLARQMQAVYLKYNPAGEMLSVTMDGGYINIGDSYVTDNCEVILDANGRLFRTVDAIQVGGEVKYCRR